MKLAVIGSRIFVDLNYVALVTRLALQGGAEVLTGDAGLCDQAVIKVVRGFGEEPIVFRVRHNTDGYRAERVGLELERLGLFPSYREASECALRGCLDEAERMLLFQQRVHGRATPETVRALEIGALRLNPVVVDWDGFQRLPPARAVVERLYLPR